MNPEAGVKRRPLPPSLTAFNCSTPRATASHDPALRRAGLAQSAPLWSYSAHGPCTDFCRHARPGVGDIAVHSSHRTDNMRVSCRRGAIRTARCIAALALLAALPLSPSLFGGRVLLPADLLMVMLPFRAHAAELGFERVSNPILDAVQQFWPWRKFAGYWLRRGVIPWWNPHMLCGTPFVANDQSAVFYPETWLFALMPPEHAFAWAAFVYALASGCFMFLFLRLMGLRRRPATLGAAAWMYNGFVVGWMCLPSFRSVPGWLPLMLASVLGLSRSDRPAGWVALGAVAVAMNFLAGNLHITFYTLVVFSAFAGWLAARDRQRALLALSGAAAMIALGMALAAVQLLPTFEYAARSHRRAISYATALTYRLPWPYLAACLMPDLFGNPVDYNHWGCFLGQQYRAYTETAWYTGALTVVLALLALTSRRWRAQAIFWWAILVFAFALALGSPLNWLLYRFVPGFRQLPGINRAIVIACFAMPVLGALGLQSLIDWPADHSLDGAPDDRRQRRAKSAAQSPSPPDPVLALWAIATSVLLTGLASASWAWLASARYEAPGLQLGRYTWLQFLRFGALLILPTAALHAALRTGRRGTVFWTAAIFLVAADVSYFAAHFIPQVSACFCHPPSRIADQLRHDSAAASKSGRRCRLLSIGSNAITGRMPPNVPMLFGLADIQGSDSITFGRYIRLVKALSDDRLGFDQPDPLRPFIRRLGVRWLLTDTELPEDHFALREVEGRALLYEAPPTWLADAAWSTAVAVSDDRALELLASPAYDPSSPPLVPPWAAQGLRALGLDVRDDGAPMATQSDSSEHPSAPSWHSARPLRLLRPQPSVLRITAAAPPQTPATGTALPAPDATPAQPPAAPAAHGKTAGGLTSPAILAIHETFYPGWRAYAGRRRLRMIPVDYCFCGVVIGRGRAPAQVTLVFEPTAAKLGGFLSCLGLVLLATLAVFAVGSGMGANGGEKGPGR